MRIKEDAPAQIEYKLAVGAGRWVLTNAPRNIAAELVRRGKTYETVDDGGFELEVNGRMRFPQELFEVEEGDELRTPEAEKPKRRRAAKA